MRYGDNGVVERMRGEVRATRELQLQPGRPWRANFFRIKVFVGVDSQLHPP